MTEEILKSLETLKPKHQFENGSPKPTFEYQQWQLRRDQILKRELDKIESVGEDQRQELINELRHLKEL